MREITNVKELKSIYAEKIVKYNKLGELIKLYLTELLKEEKIPHSVIQMRIKDFESLFGKIKRYPELNFNNVFDHIKTNDICGLRVICTFKEDIKKVETLIDHLFHVTFSEIVKHDRGYECLHIHVELKENFCSESPFYNNLQSIKAEIQVRTIAQHSWAEATNILSYKKESMMPALMGTILKNISKQLDNVDSLYDELKKEKAIYIEQLRSNFDEQDIKEIDIDKLNILLERNFENSPEDVEDTYTLFYEIENQKLNIRDINDLLQKVNDQTITTLDLIRKDVTNNSVLSKSANLRLVLSLYHPMYWAERKKILNKLPDGNIKIKKTETWIEKLNCS